MKNCRSECPTNLAVEALGDRCSMLILRHIIFLGQRTYRALLNNSAEGISSNILADRLNTLCKTGMLTRTPDPNHRQRAILSLTEKSIALAPVLIEIGYWGASFLSTNPGLCIPATMLHEGGRELAEELMDDIRHLHLGHSRTSDGPLVLERVWQAMQQQALERRTAT